MKDINMSVSARKAAYDSLLASARHGKYTNIEVSYAIAKNNFSDADKRLYTNLVYGVTERLVTLDYIIEGLSSRPLSKTDPETLCCLRLGIYQLLFTDRIPDHAAVSETVSLAKKQSKGYVNALLREFLRRGKEYKMPSEEDRPKYYSVKYSCPEKMCAFLISKLGEEKTEKLLASTVGAKKAYVRVNTLVSDIEEVIASSFPEGRPYVFCDDIIELDSLGSKDMSDPSWFVQDPASRLAVSVLDPKSGDTVVDTCSAPGGKSFSAAIDMKNEGKIYSFDLHENKISLIRSGAERLGIEIIEAACRDASYPDESLVGKADRVICDAPCSGLGVMGKKPDIKYKDISDIERLPDIQLKVLKGASEYVADGGVLVYSTCTVNPDENEGTVGRFLAENTSFELVPFSVGKIASETGMLTLLPHEYGTDGFFISKMRRKNAG